MVTVPAATEVFERAAKVEVRAIVLFAQAVIEVGLTAIVATWTATVATRGFNAHPAAVDEFIVYVALTDGETVIGFTAVVVPPPEAEAVHEYELAPKPVKIAELPLQIVCDEMASELLDGHSTNTYFICWSYGPDALTAYFVIV